MTGPRIALTTYSVKPRGGVVHTLELAESLQAQGADVTVVAMGDPELGFFRDVDVPVRIVEAPPWTGTLEERVFSWIDALTNSLKEMSGEFDIIHSQDCISARAAAQVRDAGSPFKLVRTVHHVDDFTTQALIDCQIKAITEPDHVLVVSEMWRRQLWSDYGIESTVITNGVRADRFRAPITSARRKELRDQVGVDEQYLFLTIGGIEPRKGSKYLIEAMGILRGAAESTKRPVLAIIGGHSFQDYNAYRSSVLESLPEHGLEIGEDVVLLGTVDDDELPDWFHAADAFVFPSTNEGFGLVVLEAMSAGLPVVTSDIEVFQEFLTDGTSAVMTECANPRSLAQGMDLIQRDPALVETLRSAGSEIVEAYSWELSARQHMAIYRDVTHSDTR